MKTLITILFLMITTIVNGQIIQYKMTDFTNFTYPAEFTFWESLDSCKVEFDSIKYLCNTTYLIDIPNGIFSYVIYTGEKETFKIKNTTQNDVALMVEVPITGRGTYNYLFGKNIEGNTSLIVRRVEENDGKVLGFFTNKVELVK